MARTAASSRSRAMPTRSSSLSASAAACWACVTGMSSVLRFDALDASTAERFLARIRSKKDPLPVVLFGPSGGPAWCRGRRNGFLFRRPRIPVDEIRIVVGSAIDLGGNLIGFEQIFRGWGNQRRRGFRVGVCAIEPQIEGLGRNDNRHPLMDAGKRAIGARRHDGGGFH